MRDLFYNRCEIYFITDAREGDCCYYSPLKKYSLLVKFAADPHTAVNMALLPFSSVHKVYMKNTLKGVLPIRGTSQSLYQNFKEGIETIKAGSTS
jgi:hypothetical protein